MAENVDRHRNSVMNLEYTFSQRLLGNKWQMFRSHEHTRATWWLGGQTILATYRQPKDSLTITTFDCTERMDCFPNSVSEA
jgi:hypothetical protein